MRNQDLECARADLAIARRAQPSTCPGVANGFGEARSASLRAAALLVAAIAAAGGCATQPEPPVAAAAQDAKDAGGVDAEFGVKTFALTTPTITPSSPNNAQNFPIPKGGSVSIDVAYAVTNYQLGQVRCHLDGVYVGLGSATGFKFLNVTKGAHALSCAIADNNGTELVDATARFNLFAKVVEPCPTGSADECKDGNACSQDACVDLQCVYDIVATCCQSKYQCLAGEVCLAPNESTSKCSSCAVNADCDDKDTCTTDVCNVSGLKGVCNNTKSNPDCCTKATDPCDDGKSCTVDSCDVATGKCKHIQPVGVCCKDSDCTAPDPCLQAQCVDMECRFGPDSLKPGCCTPGGYNAACDDKNYCTIDKCDKPQTGGWIKCSNAFDPAKPNCCEKLGSNAQCDDQLPCTVDICDNYVCKNLEVKACCTQTLDCDDQNPCTLDKCNIEPNAKAGLCAHEKIKGCCTTVADCDDNKFCTLDSCIYSQLTCKYTKTDPTCCDADVECDDGKFCTVNVCVNTKCAYGPDVTKPNCCDSTSDCNDSNACTTDTCDLGPSKLPPVTAGLVAHYDARDAASVVSDANGNVTQWKDLSGNSRHLTPNGAPPVYGQKLIGELPAVNFNGADRRMTTAAFPLTTEVTVFAVVQWKVPDPWGAIVHHGSRDNDWSIEHNAAKAGTSITHFQSVSDNSGVELTLGADTNYILSGRVQGTTRSYIAVTSGAALAKAEGSGNSIGAGTKVLYVGSSDASEDSKAFIGQILYYNKALTDTDRDIILNWLRASWGIDAPPPQPANVCKYVSNGVKGCCNTNEECNDNDCTTADYCDGANTCKNSPAVGKCKADFDCDDGKACTLDKCVVLNGCGECVNTNMSPKDCCDSDVWCNDDNPCTTDKCGADNKCTSTAVDVCCTDDANAQTVCNDNNACTIDYCSGYSCHHTLPTNGCCASDADCNDNNACSADKCNNIVAGKGSCSNTVTSPTCNQCDPAKPASYDDGNPCTSDLCLQVSGVWKQSHTPMPDCCVDKFDCNDNKPCTYDYCIFNQCVHPLLESGVALCCTPETELTECAYLNSSCAEGKCVKQTDGALKCQAVEKTPCVVNLSYCQDFDGTGTLKQLGWIPGDVNGTAATNWSVAKSGALGPDQYAQLNWTPTKSNFLTCLQSPVIQAAGAAAVTMQFDRAFIPAINSTTLTVRGSLGGASVDWTKAVIIDGPINASTPLGPDKYTVKLPPELTGSNGLRLAFCVAAADSTFFDEFAVDNVCVVKGGPPKVSACPVNQTVGLGSTLSVPIKVFDPDADDVISVQLVSGPPFVKVSSALYHWADVSWNSAVVVTPTQLTDVGEHTVTIKYTDGYLSGTCTFKITVTYAGGYLIWAPTGVPTASALAIKAALTTKGQFGQIIDDLALYPDLTKFSGVFVTLGVYPDNHVLIEGEVSSLKTYLTGGGKLYLEGGDTFAADPQTTLHPFFKIKGVLGASPNGVPGPLKGFAAYADTSTSPPTPKTWGISQAWEWNNELDQIDGLTGVLKTRNLLKNDGLEKFWVAVGHDNPSAKYRTIGTSVPFGAVTGQGADTPVVMMDKILNFFTNGFVDCTKDTDCDDGNACTADKCSAGACTNDNTCLCGAQTTVNCGDNLTKLVNNGGDSTQVTSSYSCDLVNTYPGKEVAYAFKSNQGKPVTVAVKNVTNAAKAHLFVLKATAKGCDPLGCIAQTAVATGTGSLTFAAGANIQYYIVIDTVGSTDATQFDLSVTCGQGEDCTNGQDDNANGKIDCLDKDSCCGDAACQVEICNGIDDNCSGTIDEGCDDDGDGWCDAAMTTVGKPLTCPNGGGDCADQDGTINPGLPEVCNNGKDDNCSGAQNEDDADKCVKYYVDLDGDTFGTGAPKCMCAPSGTYKATKAGDCNDAKTAINPSATETCDTADDDNCDGSTNDVNATKCVNFYTDLDGDLWGTTPFKCMCQGAGAVTAKEPGDCVDSNAGINPAAAEICNDLDDNCNTVKDEGCDDDKDGYCDTGLNYVPVAGQTDVCNKASDGAPLNLACPAGSSITAVKFAAYGTVTGSCPTFTKGTCDAGGVVPWVQSQCIGKTSCSFINFHLTVGDPCVNVVKTMAVILTCTSSQSAAPPICPLGPGDTDDNDPAINPAGKEICDGKDNNSDGQTDEDCDKDKDGYCDAGMFTVGKPQACPLGGGDCNDTVAQINPGVAEDCKTPADDNCNGGNNDLGAVDCTPYFFDNDGDKWGTTGNKCFCQPVGQYSAINPGDCNDDNKAINPQAKEICDNLDNDCDKEVDNTCDDDGDGYCDAAVPIVGTPTLCQNGGGDCNDTDAQVNPGKAEVCGNGKDDNCSGGDNDQNAIGCIAFYSDADGDTYGVGTKKCQCVPSGTFTATNDTDCDDNDKAINLAAAEACNGKDDNCKAGIDEGCDDDLDGYCDSGMVYEAVKGSQNACATATEGATLSLSCGAGGTITQVVFASYGTPTGQCGGYATSACNAAASAQTVKGACVGKSTCAVDANSGVFGDPCPNIVKKLTVEVVCTSATGIAPPICPNGGGDCDDTKASVHKGKTTEVCDGLDDDCDGKVDNGCDDDGDGYCDAAATVATPLPSTCAKGTGDCDDYDSSVYPTAKEVCNNLKDDNCNGSQNDANAIGCTNLYFDEDGDSYGLAISQCLCQAAGSYKAPKSGDCDDKSTAVAPGKTEVCDGVDNNCDGTIDELGATNCKTYFYDSDKDGYGLDLTQCACASAFPYTADKKGDCDDTNPAMTPGKAEVCDNIDNNCDSQVDEACNADGDAFCAATKTVVGTPAACPLGGGDCNDSDKNIHPAGNEVCNGKDDNCSNGTDEGCDDDKDQYCDAGMVIQTVDTVQVLEDNFNSGSPGWSVGTTSSCGAQGAILGGYNVFGAGAKTSKSLSLASHTLLTIRFDFVKIDSWDGESGQLWVDGKLVWSKAYSGAGTPLCGSGNSGWVELVDKITVTIAHSAPTAKIEFTSTLDQTAADESWGVDNVIVSTASSYPTSCPKGGADCNDGDAGVNPGNAEVCGNAIDENCTGSINDPDAKGCSIYYVDFDGDGYGKGSTIFGKVAINEVRFAVSGGFTTAEYIELLVTGDLTAQQLDSYFFGDSTATGAAKFSAYKTNVASLGIATLKAGTLITITGATGPAADLTYNPAFGDWNLTLKIGSPEVTTVLAGGDFATSDVVWIDTASTGTTSVDSWRWGSASGALGAAAKVTLAGAPSGTPTGVIAFTGDITGLNQAANYAIEAAATPGAPNGGTNTTFVNWLRAVSTKGDSQCLCVASATYKTLQGGDCNDGNASVFSGATEICDGVDNNCNGVADEGCDGDGDGYCDLNKITIGKPAVCPNGGGDCNDAKNTVNPGAKESCTDAEDTNCDGTLNADGATGCSVFYYDGDNDGVGVNISQCLCAPMAPFKALGNGDCDDTNASVKPGVSENCATSYDDNCNGNLNDAGATNCVNFYPDLDKDGYGLGSAVCTCTPSGSAIATVQGDCNDGDNQVNPGMPEQCDNKDNNCNGGLPSAVEKNAATGTSVSLNGWVAQEVVFTLPGTIARIDAAFNVPSAQQVTLYLYKTATLPTASGAPAPIETIGPINLAQNGAGVYTKYTFTSTLKPSVAAGEKWALVWKASSTGAALQASTSNQYAPAGLSTAPSSPFSWTGQGQTDVTFTAWLVVSGTTTDEGCDDDGDKHCDAAMVVASPPPVVCSNGGGDCNDNAAAINKAAAETCDAVDNNCNGASDEGCDDDKDGWCDSAMTVAATPPPICSAGKNDCDDTNSQVYPGKTEICDDIDNNCSSVTDENCDVDNDDYCVSTMATAGTPKVCPKGGGDCADGDGTVNPGVTEACDGKDNNCAAGVDENCADIDKDGYCNGNVAVGSLGCPKGGGDCNDSDSKVNPGATETCATLTDDNCNGLVNEANATACTNWYADVDQDGWGGGAAVCQCTQSAALPANQGGDCKDTDVTVNPGQTEVCDGLDNDCLAGTDNGCDDDGDLYCDNTMTVKDTALCKNSLTTCATGAMWPPVYKGSPISMETYSHGGGYNPYYKEYWYPQWAGGQIYRYNDSYQYLGSFNCGQGEIMGLWGDTDGDFYTANWGYGTITKRKGMSSTQVWSFSMGAYASGVTADANFVYAMRAQSGDYTVYKLKKTDGTLVESFNLTGASFGSWMYGGLAVVNGYLLVGRENAVIYRFDLATKALVGTSNVATNIYNMAFNGTDYCISPNSSQVYCYKMFGQTCSQVCTNSIAWPPKKSSVVNMNTYSHGGGYSPKYKEFWYPQWNGATVYRFNSSYNYVGSFNAGIGDIMQLWGETDGTYYTANWGQNTITKRSDMGSVQVWSYNIGTTAGGVTADKDYVYALGADQMVVHRLNKATGGLVDKFALAGGGSETIYGGLAVSGNHLLVGRGSGTVYHYDLGAMADAPIFPGIYTGAFSMNTYSHGGGFSPKYQEFWYPSWSGQTIYRFNKQYQYLGNFNSGQDQMMQLWGEPDGTYYTANWGYGTVTKMADKSSTRLWTRSLGSTMGGVTADANYVYAMAYTGSTVWQLNKSNGNIVTTFNLSGGNFGNGLFGGLAVVGNMLLVGRDNAVVYRYNLTTKQYIDSFNVATNIYNMAFTGTDYCISNNGSTVWCYQVFGKSAPLLDTFATASNIYNMAFTGTGYCTSPNSSTVYCYSTVGQQCTKGDDCDDTKSTVKPGGLEQCDNADNNCDTIIDDGCDDDNDNYCDKDLTLVGTPSTCTGGGGDCNDNAASINPAPTTKEICATSYDDNCDGQINGLNAVDCTKFYYDNDGDGQGTTAFECRCAPNGKYAALASGDCDDNDPVINSGLGAPKPTVGVYKGSPITMETYSHGGGYSHKYKEYWYPQWAGSTIYRYNQQYTYLGAFYSGLGQIMQLWGDVDDFYYTANWGYNTVSKWQGMTGNQVWQTNIGSTAGGVSVDGQYVYAMRSSGMQVWVLDKTNGAQIKILNLNGGSDGSMYGGLAVVSGVLYVGRDNMNVYRYDAATGNFLDSFTTAANIYNMSFNGSDYCVSPNNNQVYCYTILKQALPPEQCDGKDNNCNGVTDETCDVDKDGYCDAKLTVSSNAACPKSVIKTTNCNVYTLPPKYKGGPISMNTRSHGGGYSPKYNEYWYPEWSGTAIYRYDGTTYAYKGVFYSGQNQMMQLWGEPDGTYYTANWGYNTITKKTDMGSGTLWTYNIGSTAGGVTSDATYVYAMWYYGMQVHVLNKSNGALVKYIKLNGGEDTTMYGGMAVIGGDLFIGRYNQKVHRYDLATGQFKDTFTTADSIYNMAFNGKEYCISANSSSVHCYSLYQDKCNLGDDCDDLDKTKNPGIKELCDASDNNCDGKIDDGCDDDGDGYCDATMVVVGNPVPQPGVFKAQVNMDTRSHGGGYSPKYKEYWYPEWAGPTIYRYDATSLAFKGTFNSGQGEMMQLWGDTDGTYYTANWGYNTITKKSDMGSNTLWTYNIGSTAGGVTADNNYVYAMWYYGMQVHVLNKQTGQFVKYLKLSGGVDTTMYGGLVALSGYLYLGRYNGQVYRYKLSDGSFVDSFGVANNIHNMAFNGQDYCISPNSSQVWCYTILAGGCPNGGGDCDDNDATMNPGGTEVCNGGDDNCNKLVDEAGSQGCNPYYYDGDQDGYGVNSSQCLCESAKQFMAVGTPTTWANAQAACKAWGGSMVVIGNHGDNKFVRDFANSKGVTGNVWIGLNDAANEGNFVWDGGKPLSYNNWDNNEPQGVYFAGTTMLTVPQQQQLNSWHGTTNQKWKLCYKGTQDGWNVSTFHAKCDQYATTLTVAKDINGNYFGGYSPASWSWTGGYKVNIPGAWMFQLNKGYKSTPGGCSGGYHTTYPHPSYGPTFGGGHDLHIDSSMRSGYTYFGYSYTCPVGSCGNGACMSYLSYQYSGWQLAELEIYTQDGTTGGPGSDEDYVYMKGTGKWADDLSTATAGYVCSKTSSLFTSKLTNDCNDSCATCYPGGPAEICDGNDQNCNNSIDEGCNADGDAYCSAQKTTVGTPPICPKGGGDCNDNSASVSPGALELCNNADDNCNSIIDEQASDGCPQDKNAVFKCVAGQCQIQACANFTYDLNGSWTDGCECLGNDANEPNDSCGQAVTIDAALYDNSKSASIEGKVVTTDVDWYAVNAVDLGDGGYAACDKFNLRVWFTKQPGGLVFDIYKGACPTGPLVKNNSDPEKSTNQAVCCGSTDFNWFTNFKGAQNGDHGRQWSEWGECPCQTGNRFDQSNYAWSNSPGNGGPYCSAFNSGGVCIPTGWRFTECKDDSSWYYIRVHRPNQGTKTCGNYKLEVSNGLYGQPGTGYGRKGN